MSDINYYQSYKDYFWVWEENYEVISIRQGSTIVYTEELKGIVKALAENGLPHFGSLLLCFIAINKTAMDSLSFIDNKRIALNEKFGYRETSYRASFDFLKLLQSLPEEFKIGHNRQILMRTIFFGAHNRRNIVKSKNIAKLLNSRNTRLQIPLEIELKQKIYDYEFSLIEIISRKFPTTQSILDAMAEMPEMAYEVLPELPSTSITERTYKDFVEELMDDASTFKVGALIKPIWAGFKIPIFNAQPSSQPLGGISDLSNKGSFDKLLISEFANDDLVFLSRVANNEALYLEREMPPVTDQFQRVILIDISLKTWGTPKILAFATSIAISKHPKSKSECSAFLVGDSVQIIDFESKNNLINALQMVSVGLSAQHGLTEFLNLNKQNKKLELFFVTTPENLKQAEINKIISENQSLFKYFITVDLSANISFYRNKNNAFKHLQTINLPLKSIWKESPKKPIKPLEISNDKLESPPILLPIPIKRSVFFQDEDQITYFVTKEGLFRIVVKNSDAVSFKGCELIFPRLHVNSTNNFQKLSNGQQLFISINHQNKEASIVNLSTRQYARSIFREWKYNFHSLFFLDNDEFVYRFSYSFNLFYFTPNFEEHTIQITKKTEDVSESPKPNGPILGHNKIDENSQNKRHYSVLKKFNFVSIDEFHQLVFSGHRLGLLNNNCFFDYRGLEISKKLEFINSTPQNGNKSFVFRDGSQVLVNSNGYLILKSSDELIPTIYLSSVVENTCAMATEEVFSGMDYFFKIPYIRFQVKSVNTNKLLAMKHIKSHTYLSIDTISNFIKDAPYEFSLYMELPSAKLMVDDLREIGMEIDYLSDCNEQNKIDPEKFYKLYIQEFINRIVKYETRN